MKGLLGTAAACAVMALAFWAYQENYRTQAALRELAALERQIDRRADAIAMLRAEWAYLNRPDRLRDLAEINFDRLGLVPLSGVDFADPATIPFPVPIVEETETTLPILEEVVSTRGPLEQEP